MDTRRNLKIESICREFTTDYVEYCPSSGTFLWKIPTSNRVKKGEIAGSYSSRYATVSFKNTILYIHKLVYYKETGIYPLGEVDHIDHDTKNNRFKNLRLVISLDNAKNKPQRRDNTSGITGVSFDKSTNKWVVRIKNNEGKYANRGRFNTLGEAKQARDRALSEYGYHPNHGIGLSKLQYRKQ